MSTNNISTSGLESLLQAQDRAMSGVKEDRSDLAPEEKTAPHKAERCANIFDFIQMVGKVVTKSMRDENVEFVLDEGKRLPLDTNTEIDHPYITYKVLGRKPKGERKPRVREDIVQENTFSQAEARQGRIYGQKFSGHVQFNIFASEYTQAERVMNNFEDLIFSFTHYFKRGGVAELLFEEHLTDKDYDPYRQSMSVRSLVYYLEIEKLYVMFNSEIDEVFVN